ncbi:hypothetical protein STPH2_7239 [Streptomyces sp. KO7888]|nr:hypothetical protein [Streptomyces sp. KO7888]
MVRVPLLTVSASEQAPEAPPLPVRVYVVLRAACAPVTG